MQRRYIHVQIVHRLGFSCWMASTHTHTKADDAVLLLAPAVCYTREQQIYESSSLPARCITPVLGQQQSVCLAASANRHEEATSQRMSATWRRYIARRLRFNQKLWLLFFFFFVGENRQNGGEIIISRRSLSTGRLIHQRPHRKPFIMYT